ncbi:uncharacterized protein BT62DRAFT_685557 [Guyanagaster necrorhizus]|uniref:Uncharacterized protein n=1 Tax=Guyanagaster necrorhizus TaxID=856835 RepID=A0A9P8AVM0_9AGAR|nr:uncharacterized protein BT62DRAFT_685557 [Guyanagaster necrorhizus MCA 3950]KAG7449465.1 hypothetical protein BT62DRAFT_685557 [Guyanagaster necrorhizus MCA 3950]
MLQTLTFRMVSSFTSYLPVSGRDQNWKVGIPMHSFQGGYYKRLIAFCNHLRVKFASRDFSYPFFLLSMSEKGRQLTTELIYHGVSGFG